VVDVLGELFLVAVISFFIWTIGQRFYPKHAPNDHPGLMFTPWRRRLHRAIWTFILVCILIDLWYRLTGRGQFLH
jgi:hypothetical protein